MNVQWVFYKKKIICLLAREVLAALGPLVGKASRKQSAIKLQPLSAPRTAGGEMVTVGRNQEKRIKPARREQATQGGCISPLTHPRRRQIGPFCHGNLWVILACDV